MLEGVEPASRGGASNATDAARGPSVDGAPAATSGAAQWWQKRCPGVAVAPQPGHEGAARLAPQFPQKRAPSGFSLPQAAQLNSAPFSARAV